MRYESVTIEVESVTDGQSAADYFLAFLWTKSRSSGIDYVA